MKLLMKNVVLLGQGCTHNERCNELRELEHSNVSTITNTKLDVPITIAYTYHINVQLESTFAP
jgi:hypothetical protein